jgi:hypothetical protein
LPPGDLALEPTNFFGVILGLRANIDFWGLRANIDRVRDCRSKEISMTKTPVVSTAVTPTRLALFGPPALLEGENPASYDELLARVSGAVKPADVLEEIWVRDVVDLVWETHRWRRLKANLIMATTYKGVEAVVEPMVGDYAATSLARSWARRDAGAIKKVDKLLASAGLTMDAVMAQTLSLKIDHIERIDRIIMGAEARRNVALRELDRHRASLAQALRRVSDEVEDAQFEEVEATQIADRNAA